jgi:hypothetical protein
LDFAFLKFRHCERREAIQNPKRRQAGLPRFARNNGKFASHGASSRLRLKLGGVTHHLGRAPGDLRNRRIGR